MTPHTNARHGFVLLLTLIASLVISILAVSALAFVRLERANAQHFTLTTNHEHHLSSGIEEALALLHAYPDPRRIICARNGGDPDQPQSCNYHLIPPDRSYRIDFSTYDYPNHPHLTGVAPADDPTTRIELTVDPNNDIRIDTWNLTHP